MNTSAARLADLADKITHEVVAFDAVDADAVFHRHRDVHHVDHRLDAVGHQRRLGHQAGAERAALHPLAGAAAVQVDLVIAPLLAQPGGKGQFLGLAAAELQRHRVFLVVKAQVPAQVAMAQRAGGDHLGIQARMVRQQAVEVPAVPIGPVQHRRNT
jgi:hypothetical protein